MCELFILIRCKTFNTNKSDITHGLLQKLQSKVACFVLLSEACAYMQWGWGLGRGGFCASLKTSFSMKNMLLQTTLCQKPTSLHNLTFSRNALDYAKVADVVNQFSLP